MNTMVQSILKTLFASLLLLLLAACGSGTPEPPYFGAFLVDGRELVELNTIEAFGRLTINDARGAPVSDESQPVVVLWQQDTQVQYLELRVLQGGSSVPIDYTAVPGENGIIELTPSNELSAGSYCYIQGNPLAFGLPAWCFTIE